MPAAADRRRWWRRAVALATIALLAGNAAPAATSEVQQIADGIYLLPGVNEAANASNRGDIGNAGFLVGPAGVAVVDSGSSRRAGEQLQAQIAATTSAPVRFVVLTQALPEFVLGASAFEDAGTPLLAHRETAALLRARCERCLAALRAEVGDDALRGTRIATAVGALDGSVDDLRTGRRLQLIHPPGWAATAGDLAVFEPASGVLFAGALVENARVPNLRDGKLDGWIAALEALRALPLKRVVPGHGPLGGGELIDQTLAYLRALDAAVGERYAAGASLSETVATVKLARYSGWTGYGQWHAANVQRQYLELEERDLKALPP